MITSKEKERLIEAGFDAAEKLAVNDGQKIIFRMYYLTALGEAEVITEEERNKLLKPLLLEGLIDMLRDTKTMEDKEVGGDG